MGEELPELARRALNSRDGGRVEAAFHGFAPLPPRGRPVTNGLIDQLRENEPE